MSGVVTVGPQTETEPQTVPLSGRDRALLRAVADGRATVGRGCEPVLLVDGLACADSIAVHRLFAAGLILAEPGPQARATLATAARDALRPPAAS